MVDGEGVTLHRHLLQGRSVLQPNASSGCDESDNEECVGQLKQRAFIGLHHNHHRDSGPCVFVLLPAPQKAASFL